VRVAMITLVVRKIIRATPERLFDAWTRPEELRHWWGPKSVTCIGAEIDLKVGGRYRIANQFPDGKVLWIGGEFELIERPSRLIFSWQLELPAAATERVSVTFAARVDSTEVTVTHERIANEATRNLHEQGWLACLDGLAQYASLP